MNLFIYSFREEIQSKSLLYTIIFNPDFEFNFQSFKSQYKKFLERNHVADIFIYFAPGDSELEQINNLLIRSESQKFIFCLFGIKGIVNKDNISQKLFLKIKDEGLKKIVSEGSGILESDESFHFILPSGKHSKYFFRLGNVLSNYSQINFWAFFLLERVGDNIKKIYYDTSSILSILIALINLKKNFKNDFSVELSNFNSYQGLEDYIFEDNSLIIISASNSGDLAAKIKSLNPDKIFDILFLTINIQAPNIDHVFNINGMNDILNEKQYKHEIECEYCKDNSIPVNISGEQFLPSKNIIREITIKAQDVTKELQEFLNDFLGKKLVKCHYKDRTKHREIFLDLKEYYCHPNKNLSSNCLIK